MVCENVAVADFAAFTRTLHVPTPVHAPDQPVKVAPLSGVAVRATLVPESKMALHEALPVVNKNTPDEIDEQRIPRQDQDAVRGYFNNLEKDTQK